MSINITRRYYSDEVKKDLEELLKWVKKQSPEALFNLQEVIINIIRVISNTSFRSTITKARQKNKVPADFYINGRSGDDSKYEDWLNNQGSGVPIDPWHNAIAQICRNFNLNPDKYGEFVLNYLYFCDVKPVSELVSMENELSLSEPKYKSRIVVSNNNEPLPEGAYIRFYADTTPNQITEYINKNWKIISFLQKLIPSYSPMRKRNEWLVKRDFVIYLYHALGKNTRQIGDKIAEDFTLENDDTENKDYYPNESNIRKLISNLHKEIEQSSDI